MTKLGIIGAGNISRALIEGLIAAGYGASNIQVSNPSSAKLQQLQQQFPVGVSTDNQAVAKNAATLILAVKPAQLNQVCQELKAIIQQQNTVVVSLAAGVTTTALQHYLGEQALVVRAMPNTAMALCQGATGLYADVNLAQQNRTQVTELFALLGKAVWVEQENHLDIVTALSGSGPAYLFLILDAMQQAAVKLGLPAELANQLVAQMSLGVATMAQQPDADLKRLLANVVSPQGTTAAALKVLDEAQVVQAFQCAVEAACKRAQELSQSNSNP